MNSRRGKTQLDLRNTRVDVGRVKGILIELAAWTLLRSRCRQIEDDDFKIVKVNQQSIEFMLTDKAGVLQPYTIHAMDLPRSNALTSKRMVNLYLTFALVDGTPTVDTGHEWFGMFSLWLKFWVGGGRNPKILMQEARAVSPCSKGTIERINRWKRFASSN